jgi:hypothetical protein
MKTRSKRQGYRFGVRWIAMNDDPSTMNIDDIEGYISVGLLADLFGKDTRKVAEDVLQYRQNNLAKTAAIGRGKTFFF